MDEMTAILMYFEHCRQPRDTKDLLLVFIVNNLLALSYQPGQDVYKEQKYAYALSHSSKQLFVKHHIGFEKETWTKQQNKLKGLRDIEEKGKYFNGSLLEYILSDTYRSCFFRVNAKRNIIIFAF